MVILKNKIKLVESLPPEEKQKKSIFSIIFIVLFLIIIIILGYITYIKLLPFINATDINKITGKKIHITNCNTKDYVIINKDKSYSLNITNDNCETKYDEGNLIIKNNEITFSKDIKGKIDSNYNIIINNNLFESEKNE